jgi:hypothetical protein
VISILQFDIETWLPVVGYEGSYVVSNQGQVRSLDRLDIRGRFWAGQILKRTINIVGYPMVTLWKAGQGNTIGIHVLMLEAFVGPRPPGMWGLHANDVKHDNRIENLRWDTPSENMYDRVRNGIHHMQRKVVVP